MLPPIVENPGEKRMEWKRASESEERLSVSPKQGP